MRAVILPAAREDILRQYRWLLDEGSPAAAARFLEAVDWSIRRICSQPGIGAPKVFRNPRLAGLRRWPVAGFATVGVYYLASGDAVRVVRVLDGRREVDGLLGGPS